MKPSARGNEMFITDREKLKNYDTAHRLWQGISSIEVTKKSKVYLTFYSGGVTEQIGNYCVLLRSEDGENFGEPIAVAFPEEGHRCYDPTLWIDPLDRLWFFWSYLPDHAVFAAVCNDPDAEELVWNDVIEIGKDVMMNKPTVLSTGEWLFPIAVWNHGVRVLPAEYDTKDEVRGSFVYKSVDNGTTIEKYGYADVPGRDYDEHMVIELKDGRLMMLVRLYGQHGVLGRSYSYDGGKTWTKGEKSDIQSPGTRFFIRRLKSGRILLINHYGYEGRNRSHLTALLSEDEGKTWPYKLLLDERIHVSYPDAKEAEDGFIYVTYDHERGAYLNSIADVYSCAREIMVAKITEDDIMAGKLMTDGSRLKQVATRLGKYADEDKNPFGELDRLSVDELIGRLMEKPNAELIPFLFAHYQIGCLNMHRIDCAKMDALVEKLENGTADREKTVTALVELFLSAKGEETEIHPVVERIKKVIADRFTEETTVEQIAETVGISRYYMCHIFKRETGLTPQEYRKELRMKKAKELLVGSDKTVSEIAAAVGFFDAGYFAKIFAKDETVTPMQYRKLLKKGEVRDKDAVYYSMIPHVDLLAESFTAPTEKAAVPSYTVSLPDEEYGFLHEAAIMAYHGKLFAAWYNCPKTELAGETPIRFTTSADGGKTWSAPKVVATDKTGKILYCPPIFHVEDGKLYMMLNQMVAPDHMHSLDLYLYEEEKDAFRELWSRPIPFKLNTNVCTMDNGKLILPGRLGELDKFPITPAAMISDSGKIDAEWRIVPMQKDGILADGSKLLFPEMSFIVRKGEILSFCRDDPHNSVPLVYKSEDYGESWSGPYSHDIPLIDTKNYSGTLSDGRHYVIGNVGVPRTKLMIYFSEKDNLRFTKSLLLQDGFSKELGYGNWWHYPSACEMDGKLYVIYSTCMGENVAERGAALSVIDLSEI